MSLTNEQALSLRDGDVVLVPVLVKRSNNHFGNGIGVKLVCRSPEFVTPSRGEEPRQIDIYSRFIHSIHRQPVRLGDWVSCGTETGKIIFRESEDAHEVTVKLRGERNIQSGVFLIDMLDRIKTPTDLTPEEKKIFG